jgi:Cohesin loading factor
MDPMQQVRGQLQRQAAYYPQPQQNQLYTPVQAVAGASHYSSTTPQSPPQYPQYVNQRQHQHQYTEYERSIPPTFHNSNQPQAQVASSPQLVPQLQQLPNSASNVKVQVSRNRDQIRPQSKNQPKSETKSKSIDTSMLLISLAEEYIATAHKLGASATQIMDEEQIDEYRSLIATALGCLEASFKKSRLAPRLEARVRLRYASVLFEETENYMEAETALSQGVILCEQVFLEILVYI